MQFFEYIPHANHPAMYNYQEARHKESRDTFIKILAKRDLRYS